jgi:hypothetical protein
MISAFGERTPAGMPISSPLRTAIALLLQAWDYALESRRNVWDFAVEIAELRSAGLTMVDLRWLLSQGYALHAVEETKPEAAQRRFGRPGQ